MLHVELATYMQIINKKMALFNRVLMQIKAIISHIYDIPKAARSLKENKYHIKKIFYTI